MAKRRSKAEIREEIVRLAEGLDVYRDWRIDQFHRRYGPNTKLDLNTIVEPGSCWLELFDECTSPAASSIIKELQSWYSHVGGELRYFLKNGDQATINETKGFLEQFKQRTGTDFFAEAGYVRKTADKVLKRGKLAS